MLRKISEEQFYVKGLSDIQTWFAASNIEYFVKLKAFDEVKNRLERKCVWQIESSVVQRFQSTIVHNYISEFTALQKGYSKIGKCLF